jgi:hypothetical protein
MPQEANRMVAFAKEGGSVETCFSLGLHKKDLAFLKQIQTYFGGVGNIVKQGEDLYAYRVNSVKDILSHLTSF